MQVWITRTQPEASATARRVRALGHTAVLSPVLRVESLQGAVDLEDVGGLAFSSRHAVDAFAAASPALRDRPVFVTGRATAEAARLAGFREVRSADGDGRALAALIERTWRKGLGTILHPGALEPAFDLTAALASAGVQVRSYPAYRTIPAKRDAALQAELRTGRITAVLIHSAKAAELAAAMLAEAPAGGVAAYAISDSAALPLAGLPLGALHVAEHPTEAGLLRRLGPAPVETRP